MLRSEHEPYCGWERVRGRSEQDGKERETDARVGIGEVYAFFSNLSS